MRIKTGLPEKCRPQKWEDVVGNTASVKSFKTIVEKPDGSKVSLIVGASGCGKTTIAFIAATQTLKCSPMNIIELDCALDGGVGMVRQIQEATKIKTGKRVFILDEVHRLSVQAQEGLLKTLEKVKPNDHFFLCTTDPSKFKDTFLDRCQIFTINSLSNAEIEEVLENACEKEDLDIDLDVIDSIIGVVNGSARSALKTLESVLDLSKEEALDKIKQNSNIIAENEQSQELKEFFKMLFFEKDAKFGRCKKMLKLLKEGGKEHPEGIRLACINYANALLGNGGKQYRVPDTLDNLLFEYEGIYNKGQAWALLNYKFYNIFS